MVHIVQLICPLRHCVLSCAYEEGDGSFEEAKKMLAEMIGPAGPFNARCELCGSVILDYQDIPTKFGDLKEAAPFLAKHQSDQMAARAYLEAHGLTWKKERN